MEWCEGPDLAATGHSRSMMVWWYNNMSLELYLESDHFVWFSRWLGEKHRLLSRNASNPMIGNVKKEHIMEKYDRLVSARLKLKATGLFNAQSLRLISVLWAWLNNRQEDQMSCAYSSVHFWNWGIRLSLNPREWRRLSDGCQFLSVCTRMDRREARAAQDFITGSWRLKLSFSHDLILTTWIACHP